MDYLNLIILGIIQGLTEFLPVSSSGHLVFAQHFLNVQSRGTVLEVVLHFGTLTSIIIFYKNDIVKLIIDIFNRNEQALKFALFVIIGIIPAGIAGVFFKDFFISFFNDLLYTSCFLVFTGFILFLLKFMEHKSNSLSFKSSIMVGLIQALSIFPGISRSGMTISVAIFLGIEKEKAFKFSFFLAIPIILGASILEIPNIINFDNLQILPLFLGFLVSAISGFIALKLLFQLIIKNKFWMFSIYCFLIGTFGIYYAR